MPFQCNSNHCSLLGTVLHKIILPMQNRFHEKLSEALNSMLFSMKILFLLSNGHQSSILHEWKVKYRNPLITHIISMAHMNFWRKSKFSSSLLLPFTLATTNQIIICTFIFKMESIPSPLFMLHSSVVIFQYSPILYISGFRSTCITSSYNSNM